MSNPEITGMLGRSGVSVGIANITRGEIWHLNYSSIVKQYTPTIISCRFRNTGSITVLERMEMHIESLNRTLLISYYDGYYTLRGGESKKFSVNYTPVLDPGYYLIHANASYDGKSAQSWGVFLVIPYYGTPYYGIAPPQEPGGGGVAEAPFKVPELGFPKAVLSYQRAVSLSPGQTYMLPVTIENRGSASMYNTKISATGSGVVFDVTPAYIAKIARGSSGVFLISISVPVNAEPGTYTIEFGIMSDETSESGKVDVNVIEGESYKFIEDMIANYLFIFSSVKQRLGAIAAEGKNISDAFSELELAYGEIHSARRNYDAREYEKALSLLDSAKKHMENALMIAEYSTIPQVMVFLPSQISVLIAVFVCVLIISVFHILRARRRMEMIRIEKERIKSGSA